MKRARGFTCQNPGIANRSPRRYVYLMTAIASQLDEKLKSLDAKAASSLERLVRDALELVDAQNGTVQIEHLPPDFFVRISREFGDEPFERPSQGESEKRGVW